MVGEVRSADIDQRNFSIRDSSGSNPHTTVPAGMAFGLPIDISFFAGARTEATLIKFAYAFEQTTKARRKPGFSKTISV